MNGIQVGLKFSQLLKKNARLQVARFLKELSIEFFSLFTDLPSQRNPLQFLSPYCWVLSEIVSWYWGHGRSGCE